MVTLVGTQNKLAEAVQSLIELDYDAVEAYQAAINRLENKDYQSKLESFCLDHERHIKELTSVLEAHEVTPPSAPSAKQWLTKGKVVLANLLGDEAILKAMLSNEEDTNHAYEKMTARSDLWEDIKDILKRGLEDEHKHRKWLESTIQG